MPYSRESLAELSRRLESELPAAGHTTILRRMLFTPFARALAGAVHGIHDHIDWRVRQMFPQTCDDDILENLHSEMWLHGSRRRAAQAASGTVVFTGIAGTAIPAGTVLNRIDGAQFMVADGGHIGTDGTANCRVVAATPGQAGNTSSGEQLQVANTLSGITGTVSVVSISNGSDIESIDELRMRVVASRNIGGEVGRQADWVRWALEVPGITRAWAAPKLAGAGTVHVYVVRDNDAVIYPDAQELDAVFKHLEQTALPNGEIYVLAPTEKKINFRIRLTPDTPSVRAAVTSSLALTLQSAAAPLAYGEDGEMMRPARGHTIPRSHLTQAISNSAGEHDHQLLLPASDITAQIGELVSLGVIEWVT